MDYFGNLFLIACLVLFAVGSYLTAKAQKAATGKMENPQTDEGLPTEDVEPMPETKRQPSLPSQPTVSQPKSKRQVAEHVVAPTPPHTPPHHSSKLKEKPLTEADKRIAEETGNNSLAFDTDELKKAVIYSEILNRKYS